MNNTKYKGFTLIELLVVISIIGLLSSVVLASLSTARTKAKDSFLVQQAKQIQNIMALKYSESGNYSGMQSSWLIEDVGGVCPDAKINTFDIKYRDQINSICDKINDNLSFTSGNRFYLGAITPNSQPSTSAYTVIIQLSGTNRYICIGHNGKTSIAQYTNDNGWNNPGCYADTSNI